MAIGMKDTKYGNNFRDMGDQRSSRNNVNDSLVITVLIILGVRDNFPQNSIGIRIALIPLPP